MNIKKMVLAACAASVVYAAPDPNFHIYLAFGQSNMEGQGDSKPLDRFREIW